MLTTDKPSDVPDGARTLAATALAGGTSQTNVRRLSAAGRVSAVTLTVDGARHTFVTQADYPAPAKGYETRVRVKVRP